MGVWILGLKGATRQAKIDKNVIQDRVDNINIVPTRDKMKDYAQISLRKNLRKAAKIEMEWTDQGPVISYNSMLPFQFMVFSTLLPYGLGDATNKDRWHEVSWINTTAHLMSYSFQVACCTIYPLFNHSCCIFWA